MDIRLRRPLMRLFGASIVVLGVFVTATAVRRADQVVASGRDVLLGGQLVDLFTARDLLIDGHAELAGTAVALGDLDVLTGSLRVERETSSVFAVGGAVTVSESASVVFPETGTLKYGTIRTGAVGSAVSVTRDPGAVVRYAEMVPSLATSSICFGRTASTGLVRRSQGRTTLIGDGVSGLQVFHLDGELSGEIDVSRVPTMASVLINITGTEIQVGPSGADWREIAEHTLINVPNEAQISVDTGDGIRSNLLVGSADGDVRITGSKYVGTVLSLSAVTVTGTRFEHGPLLAAALPDCVVGRPSEPEPEVGDQLPATTTSTSISTTTTTTTTTIVSGGFVPRGAAPVPGAAFALGGAASTGRWWLGVPLSMLGAVVLGWGWINAWYRQQHAQRHRRRLPVKADARQCPLRARRSVSI